MASPSHLLKQKNKTKNLSSQLKAFSREPLSHPSQGLEALETGRLTSLLPCCVRAPPPKAPSPPPVVSPYTLMGTSPVRRGWGDNPPSKSPWRQRSSLSLGVAERRLLPCLPASLGSLSQSCPHPCPSTDTRRGPVSWAPPGSGPALRGGL